MVFITPCYKKPSRGLWLLLTLALLAVNPPVRADFRISDMQPRIDNETLVLSGELQLTLSPKAEEALSKGIAIEVIIDIGLYRKRRFVWDETLGRWALTRRIGYHALSGQYLTTLDTNRPDEIDNHTSLQEALKQLGALIDLGFPLPTKVTDQGQLFLDVRVNLDIEALPPPLRPVAYTSFAWYHNSGWTRWEVRR